MEPEKPSMAVAPAPHAPGAHPHHRKHRHSRALAFFPALIVAAVIGAFDVLTVVSVWPSVVELFVGAFCIAWLVPRRWLTVAATMTVTVWAAYLMVRAPWWAHPDEAGPHDYAAVLVAAPCALGAMIAGRVQIARANRTPSAHRTQRTHRAPRRY